MMFLQCMHNLFCWTWGIFSLNLSDFWVKQVDFFYLFWLDIMIFYILSDEVHKYQDFQSIIIALNKISLNLVYGFVQFLKHWFFLVCSKNSSIKIIQFLAIVHETWAHYLWNLSLEAFKLFFFNIWQNNEKLHVFLHGRCFCRCCTDVQRALYTAFWTTDLIGVIHCVH